MPSQRIFVCDYPKSVKRRIIILKIMFPMLNTEILLSAKIIQTIIYVSVVPKNSHCGYIFEKVSPRQSKRDGSGGVSFASAIILDQSFSGFSKKV